MAFSIGFDSGVAVGDGGLITAVGGCGCLVTAVGGGDFCRHRSSLLVLMVVLV